MTSDYFIKILEAVRSQSTCSRLKVGAALFNNGRIISTGWNGVSSGQKHCNEISHKDHHEFSTNNEIHAEANCIGFAAKHGLVTENTILYTSVSPCIHCAKLIKAAGISLVYYIDKYDNEKEDGIKFLINNNVECIKI